MSELNTIVITIYNVLLKKTNIKSKNLNEEDPCVGLHRNKLALIEILLL